MIVQIYKNESNNFNYFFWFVPTLSPELNAFIFSTSFQDKGGDFTSSISMKSSKSTQLRKVTKDVINQMRPIRGVPPTLSGDTWMYIQL